jgi:hypothetical protein
MTLDASGNLGVGNTNPSSFDAFANNLVVGNGSGSEGITIYAGSTQSSSLSFADGTGAASYQGFIQYAHSTDSLGFFVNYSGSANARMTIDSSGNLLVGTTDNSLGGRFIVYESSGDVSNFYSTDASMAGQIIAIRADRNTTNNSFYAIGYYNTGAAAYKFRVADSGNVTNTNNSYGAISDVKLKENIVDASPKLADLMQVKVRNYNLIGDTTKQLGVVAQELETVFPAMVDESPDRDGDGNDLGTTTKQVKYSVFVPMLIKALQELKTEFDAYKASHP